MEHSKTDEKQQAGIAQLVEHLICNGARAGAETPGNPGRPAPSPTASPTRYYLEAWGQSWRIIDLRRGWGFRDSVAVCQKRDDALLILGLLNGGRG